MVGSGVAPHWLPENLRQYCNCYPVASFKGEYTHAIDAKGRVSFPSKLRKFLSPGAQENFTILRGLENCLLLYPEDKWRNVEDSLSQLNAFKRENRTVLRNFLRSAEDVSLDNQNRIALPSKLMEWADITSKVVFIGMGDCIELWSPDTLNSQDGTMEDDAYVELFEKVMGDV